MRNLKIIFFCIAALACLGVASCTSDDVEVPDENQEQDDTDSEKEEISVTIDPNDIEGIDNLDIFPFNAWVDSEGAIYSEVNLESNFPNEETVLACIAGSGWTLNKGYAMFDVVYNYADGVHKALKLGECKLSVKGDSSFNYFFGADQQAIYYYIDNPICNPDLDEKKTHRVYVDSYKYLSESGCIQFHILDDFNLISIDQENMWFAYSEGNSRLYILHFVKVSEENLKQWEENLDK